MKLALALDSGPRRTDALVVGENSVDLVAGVAGVPMADSKHELASFDELPGGEAATAAVGLARLGWRTQYIGRFGDDARGALVRAALLREDVTLDGCVVVPDTPNRCAIVLVDPRGGRTVLWQRPPRLGLQPTDVSDAAIASSRILLVGSDDVPAMHAAARRARAFGVRTVGDIERISSDTAALLKELDVIVMASAFPERWTGRPGMGSAVRQIADFSGAALTCVTLGEEGCLAVAGGHELWVPAFRTAVVDTTGAGDLFRAGVIARWLAEPEQPAVGELLRYASAVAALGCRARGAQGGAPRRAEVDALLA